MSTTSPSDVPVSLRRGSTLASRKTPTPPVVRRLVSVASQAIPLDGGGLFGRRRGRSATAELLVDVATGKSYVQVEGDLRPVVTHHYPDDSVEEMGIIRRHDPTRDSTTRDPDPQPVEFRAERPLRRYGVGFGGTPSGDTVWGG